MGREEAAEILRLLARKYNTQKPWPEYPKTADSEIQDLYEELWEYDLVIAGMVSRVIEKGKPPFLRYRAPIKPRRRIEAMRLRKPDSSQFLDALSQVCDEIEDVLNLVERLRDTARG